MEIKAPTLRQLHAELGKKHSSREDKLEFLSTFFDEEFKSSNELTDLQAQEVIYFLRTGKATDHTPWAFFDKENQQHRTILSLAHQLGWVHPRMVQFADLNRIGGWLKSKRSPVQKPLKDMTSIELNKIINAMSNMVKGKYK